jgi:hypothetical protein
MILARYPTDLTDTQWAVLAPLIPAARAGGRPRTTDMREVDHAGRPIPLLVSEIQAATTNAGARPQGGLTPDFLALSVLIASALCFIMDDDSAIGGVIDNVSPLKEFPDVTKRKPARGGSQKSR